MKNTNFVFLLSTLFLLFIVNPVSAKTQIMGEIINIDNQNQIAFTDLNNYYLHPGDTVEIYKDSELLLYLEVLDSTSAISKLIPLKTKDGQKTTKDFNKIQIGDKVLKKGTDSIKNQSPKETFSETANIPNNRKIGLDVPLNNSDANALKQKTSDITLKYTELLKKHTDIVKSLITLNAEKKILQSNNELLGNEIKLAQDEIKNLKMTILTLQNRINQLENDSSEEACKTELHNTKATISDLKDKLRKVQKYLEGKNKL